MNAKQKLYTMALLGAILNSSAQSSQKEYLELENESSRKPEEPKKIIPKGCKEYHFTKSGRFDTTETMWSNIDYIFTCVASNDKTAIKKFEKFISNQK